MANPDENMDVLHKTSSFFAGRVVLVLAVLLASPGLVSATPVEFKPVGIGVLAKRGTQQCLEQWEPTAKYLTKEIPGYTFRIIPLAYDEVAPAVAQGKLDFILANPSLYIELEQLSGVSRLVTLKNLCLGNGYTVYAGVIFCKACRDDIQQFVDLKGKTFIAVEEDSFGGWQMAWRELHKQGIDPYRDFASLRFGKTHDAAVEAVRDDKVDAGTVRSDTLERMAAEGKIRLDEFRVLHKDEGGNVILPFLHSTRTYPEWPLAKTRQTSDELAQKVAIALMQMPSDSPAAKSAQIAGWAIPQNYQPVDDCLKDLRIGPYKDYGKMTFGRAVRRYWPWWVGLLVLLTVATGMAVYVMRLNRGLELAVSQYRKELVERIRAEEALQKSEQLRATTEKLAAIGRLAAGVAHEINNPLTGVLTFSHLLREKEDLDVQDREDLDLIIRETTRASNIVHNLLDFARERPTEKQVLDVNEVVRWTIHLLGNQEAFQNIRVFEDFEENLPGVDADENQVQQVLVNLMLNACAAMPNGGTLTLSTTFRDGKVHIAVADTGTGIKREHIERIFDPFFSTKGVGKGTGLGLSVSYGLVHQHGGTLEVESQEGLGSTFTVILPPSKYQSGDKTSGAMQEKR
ncbi:MAG: PhnD/SsuA/transferrin family substrate-binding protein [Pirellulales bacterium]|nr:PhnD/SsuA/transferrin family substrate-binding protein [Pirellulales bacterium]